MSDNRKLIERFENWEAAQYNDKVAGQVSTLRSEYTKAFEAGDGNKAFQISRELVRLEATPVPRREPEPEPDATVDQGDLQQIATWASTREWTQQGNRYQRWARSQIEDLYDDPDWAERPVEDKLVEVDRRYTKRTQPSGGEVLSGGDSAPPSRGPKLTGDQKKVAAAMYGDMPPKDAYARYAKGMEMG